MSDNQFTKITAVFVFIMLLIILILATFSHASVSEKMAHRCIVGEAASEGYEGMVAVAEAIRNRGHLKGVYGCKANFVDNEPQWVWEKARLAWKASEKSGLVGGATHWESIDFPTPYWAYSMKVTRRIGKHIFYVER